MLANRRKLELGFHLAIGSYGFDRTLFQLAGEVNENSAESRKFVAIYNSKITKYGRNGDLRAAEEVFCSMRYRNVVSWTSMLTAYADNSMLNQALNVFDEMPERTVASYNAMITAYIRNDVSVDDAFSLFSKMKERNAVSYGAMLNGFVRAGMIDEAERLYIEMPKKWRDPVCSNVLMSGYMRIKKLGKAVWIFEGMKDRNLASWSLMIDGYCKEGIINDARELFDKMPERNVVSWTAMIDGYIKCGYFADGFGMFSRMRMEGNLGINSTTLSTVFEGCGNSGKYREGTQLHKLVLCLGFDFDVFLGNSVINMYFRCGHLLEACKVFYSMGAKDTVSWNSLLSCYVQNDEVNEAHELFEKMPLKDVVSWTIMITGYFNIKEVGKSLKLFEMMPKKDIVAWTAVISGLVDNGKHQEGVQMFVDMLRKGIKPNSLSLSSVVSASAGLASLSLGFQMHACVIKSNLALDLSIQNTLISMYSKCGIVKDAYRVFTDIEAPNIVSFNSMITGFAQNGLGTEAFKLFNDIHNAGLIPNKLSFLSVLSACVHMGLVDDGWHIFNSMRNTFKIEPGPDHYACMVDLLGRAGLLDEALDILKSMPCKPHNAIPYVVLSNLYSAAGEKEREERIINDKNIRMLRKSPGSSQISVNNIVF